MVVKEAATAPTEPAAGDGGESPEANPLAIVRSEDPPPPPPPPLTLTRGTSAESTRREEVESKISAWENEEIARITNRFQRQKAIIDGWEGEQVDRASAWLKRVERKLDEKRAKALEKMQNEVAIARQKAEERRAESEAKREERFGKVIEIARVMKIFGRDPSKRSFFKL